MIDAVVEPCVKCGGRTLDMFWKDLKRVCSECLTAPDQMAERIVSSLEARAALRFDAALRLASDPGPGVRGDW